MSRSLVAVLLAKRRLMVAYPTQRLDVIGRDPEVDLSASGVRPVHAALLFQLGIQLGVLRFQLLDLQVGGGVGKR